MMGSEIRKVLMTSVLFALICMTPAAAFAQGSNIPVVNLKTFTAVETWQLDITWHAKDQFEDDNSIGTLEMTGTARFILGGREKSDKYGWAKWHVEKAQSANLTYTGVLINKNDHSRTEWKSTGGAPLSATGATLQVGATTQGYRMNAGVAFPAKVTNPIYSFDSLVALVTADVINGGPNSFCEGPLPASGDTIHGSRVNPYETFPFDSRHRTRMGITYVMQPLVELAPLVPQKQK